MATLVYMYENPVKVHIVQFLLDKLKVIEVKWKSSHAIEVALVL